MEQEKDLIAQQLQQEQTQTQALKLQIKSIETELGRLEIFAQSRYNSCVYSQRENNLCASNV